MILAVVDDLLFRSKISSAAKALGVELAVASSADAALEKARERRPFAILLDLDGTKTRPLDLLRAFRADPELAAVRTLGFVSHVHAEVIREARAAGVDEVLARGAFAQALPDILRRLATGTAESR
ncbi:MAG: response regulator [Vicinamibacterales bacterium]